MPQAIRQGDHIASGVVAEQALRQAVGFAGGDARVQLGQLAQPVVTVAADQSQGVGDGGAAIGEVIGVAGALPQSIAYRSDPVVRANLHIGNVQAGAIGLNDRSHPVAGTVIGVIADVRFSIGRAVVRGTKIHGHAGQTVATVVAVMDTR